ncbi:MAG: hypothetical protein MJ193_03160 [Clostridia bacterium]|nr:hypothetical protein [Clostridia bacterium]
MKTKAQNKSEIFKTVLFITIIVVMLFVCAVSISIIATDVPSFFGQKIFLEKDGNDYALVKILDTTFSQGDFVLCKKGNGYIVGEVESTLSTDNGNYVAVKTGNAFSVLPEALIKGVVGDEVKGAGNVIGFFAEYRFAIVVGCVGFALIELLDIILSFVKELKKQKTQATEQ